MLKPSNLKNNSMIESYRGWRPFSSNCNRSLFIRISRIKWYDGSLSVACFQLNHSIPLCPLEELDLPLQHCLEFLGSGQCQFFCLRSRLGQDIEVELVEKEGVYDAKQMLYMQIRRINGGSYPLSLLKSSNLVATNFCSIWNRMSNALLSKEDFLE